jgi:formate-dependent phosphoribosylglycinamide formyltransferase (GAR transformylase)
MKRFEGKKLLELGTTMGSVQMVQYAKDNGAYVIVADIDKPERSAAKRIADKTYMCDLKDVEGLIKIAREEKIDGVVTGASEAILQSCRKIAEELGLPVYFTEELWNRFMRKDSFRSLCAKYGVSTPVTYYVGKVDNIGDVNGYEYPVIVKPVDASSNAGISICYTPDELIAALGHASDCSKTSTIIVEQYIDGEEISCTYVIKNHVAKMVCMGTKYPYVDENGLRALANAYLYPSPSIDVYMASEDEKVRKMFVEEGINNCTVFVQGMYKDNHCYIFEAGLRMEGTGSFRITSTLCGENFLHFQVDNALGLPTEYDLDKEDPYFHGKKCVLFSQIVKGGTIASVVGYDEVKSEERIFASEQRRYPGDTIVADGTLRQIMFRYLIYGDDMETVVELIKKIQGTVKAFDEEGNNLLVTSFNPEFVLG